MSTRPANDPVAARTRGAEVMGVDANSPVADSGLRAGDTIIALDGRPIENSAQLQTEMLTKKPGEIVVVDALRDKSVIRFDVKTRAWPE